MESQLFIAIQKKKEEALIKEKAAAIEAAVAVERATTTSLLLESERIFKINMDDAVKKAIAAERAASAERYRSMRENRLKKLTEQQEAPALREILEDDASSFSKLFQDTSYYLNSGNDFIDVIKNPGKRGEMVVCTTLDSLNFVKYIFPNVYLDSGNNITTEVDIIMVTEKAFFVIENKNHGASVYGKEDDRYWYEYYGQKKYELYNPILQNEGHIKALRRLFPQYSDKKMISLIVFSNRSKIHVTSLNVPVLHRKDLKVHINSCQDSLPVAFSPKELGDIACVLYRYCKQDKTVQANHIRQVESMKRGTFNN